MALRVLPLNSLSAKKAATKIKGTKEYGNTRRRTRYLFKKKAAKKTLALNLEKSCGILSAAGLYRSQSNSRTANSDVNRVPKQAMETVYKG